MARVNSYIVWAKTFVANHNIKRVVMDHAGGEYVAESDNGSLFEMDRREKALALRLILWQDELAKRSTMSCLFLAGLAGLAC